MDGAKNDKLHRLWDQKEILIVDDDEAVRDLISFELEEEYTITTADNAEECLAILEDEATPTPELITLDLMMPGLNGIELLKQLKADPRFADIPVVILSSVDQEDEVVTALDAGAADFIKKPFSMKELTARIKRNIEH